MKKVLFCANVVKTHIISFHLPYLKWFKEQGWETHVCAKNDFGNEVCDIPCCDRYIDISFSRNPFSPENIRAFKQLKKLVDTEHYDIVHCHTPVVGILARLACINARKHGTKVINTAHGFHFYKGSPLKNWLLFFTAEWFCSFFTDENITMNLEDKHISEKYMHAKSTHNVSGVGVKLERFKCSRPAKGAHIRKDLRIPDNAFVVLNVGEMIPRKNQLTLLKAIAELNSDVYCVILGSGKLQDELSSEAKALGISDRVKFAGFHRNVEDYHRESDIFVFPSLQEGLPIALIEAMASSLPCVALNIRGCSDLINSGSNGILVDENSADKLADAVNSLFGDRELCRTLGNNAAVTADKYELSKVVDEMAEIYRLYM